MAGLVLSACSSDDGDGDGADGSGGDQAGATADLPEAAVEIMEGDEFATARWSFLVEPVEPVDDGEGSDPVYEQNADEVSFMASNAKLYSVGTWLDVFGPDHTIATPVYGVGEVTDGTLDGDMVLRAMGDLVMGSRNAGSGELGYSVPPQGDANGLPGAKPAPGDPLAGLDDLAAQVATAGVTEVTGDVVVDDRLFEQWETPRPLEISPIVINDNLLAVVTTPGAEGDPGSIETIPETEAFEIVNETETTSAGGDTDLEVTAELDEDGEPTNTLVVSGTVAADSDPSLNVYEVVDPASWARTLFIEALERAGVSVVADPLADNDTTDVPGADVYAADGDPLASIDSPPIAEIAELIWKISHNYGADLTVCLLAVEGGSTDCEDGFAPIRERIEALGIAPGAVWLLDGSGSDIASTTPRAMTEWLSWLHGLEWGDQLPDMLPILGVDGSLSLAETDSPSTGKVQAKTGTFAALDPSTQRLLMLDQSLAGFMEAEDGTLYAFGLYMNGASFESPDEIIGVLAEIAGISAAIQQSL